MSLTDLQKSTIAQRILTHVSGLLEIVSSDPYAVEDPSIKQMLRAMSSGLMYAATWKIVTLEQMRKKLKEVEGWTI